MVWVVLSYTLNPSAISFTAVAFRYMAGPQAGFWLGFASGEWKGMREGRSHASLASGAVSGSGRCRNGNSGSRRWTLGFHPDILEPGAANLAMQRSFPFCSPGFLQLLIFG